MFSNFEFDIANFLIGTLTGFVLALLLRFRALKSLDLKLSKIGLVLGVEGADVEQPKGVKIGDVEGGISGDIAGGDIDKSTTVNRASPIYKSIRAALQDSATGMQRRGIRQRRTVGVRAATDDPEFGEHLDLLQRNDEDWFPKWIAACLDRPDIKRQIDDKITEIRTSGWIPVSMVYDNTRGGLYINIEIEKAYPE